MQYDEVAILAADKLHNLRSIRLDVESAGKQIWDRFRRPLRDQSWYYHELLQAFKPFRQTTTLIESFETELNLLFYGAADERFAKLGKLFDVIQRGFHEEDWLQETTTLCQTAYEIHETLREGYRHGTDVNQPELDGLSAQLKEAGLLEPLPLPMLQAIDELSYRTAMPIDDVAAHLKVE